jgi:predicted Rossmann fold flavoprotein
MIKKTTPKLKSPKIKTSTYDVVVIGAGPAGLIAASIAARDGAKVLVIEKNEEVGRKLLLTGGGRCNLTNKLDVRKFVEKFGKSGSFLFSPLSVFSIEDTIKFFEMLGVKTKMEEGNRVFPESDSAEDIRDALTKYCAKKGVSFRMSSVVSSLSSSRMRGSRESEMDSHLHGNDNTIGHISSVKLLDGTEIESKKFILATGGLSHQETGSTGDGFKWLKDLGHNIIAPNPALVPIKVKEHWVGDLAGTALDGVGVTIMESGKKGLSKKGRVLFTHNGLSGPTILNMSKSIGEALSYGETKVVLDLMPGVGLDILHEKMLKLFEENSNKKIKNLVVEEIPAKVFEKILEICEIDGEIEMHSIYKEERYALIEKFKKLELTVDTLLGYDHAIISSGGLDLKEVDFKTMSSKLYDNLYIAGDILDFDRPSGGYSLQLCWTTGYVAGKSSSL